MAATQVPISSSEKPKAGQPEPSLAKMQSKKAKPSQPDMAVTSGS